jgi:predicted  nucleic acid-binding Zn-ribbon protein
VALVRAGRRPARRDLRPARLGPPRPGLQNGHRPLDRPRGIHPVHLYHRRSPQLNAAPADQIRLLDVQALDVRLQQLAHKRKSLPEHAEIETLTKDLAQLRDLLVAAQTEESDCAREQTKAEQDVDQVRSRAARDQQRLDSGAVTSPKDLENLQREIASLAKRQGDLEDVVLEVMERRESAQERADELSGRVASVQSKIDDATGRRDAAFEELDGEAASVTKEREVVAGAVPADLLKLYDKLREQQGGIGAAKLYQRSCQGCRQELAITELNEIRSAAPDTVVRCENCRRILVRTAESGL